MLHALFVFILGMLSCSDLVISDDGRNHKKLMIIMMIIFSRGIIVWCKKSWFAGVFSFSNWKELVESERSWSVAEGWFSFFFLCCCRSELNKSDPYLACCDDRSPAVNDVLNNVAHLQRQRERMCVVMHRPSWGIQLHFAYCSQIMSHWKREAAFSPQAWVAVRWFSLKRVRFYSLCLLTVFYIWAKKKIIHSFIPLAMSWTT